MNNLISERRHFHSIPEVAYKEFETSSYIAEELSKIDKIAVETHIGKTGVVGLLKFNGGEGPCIMLRADMDGLPIQELSDVPFKSKNEGRMHACGHDGHMAMLLCAARILSQDKFASSLRGSVKFVFQPGKEV